MENDSRPTLNGLRSPTLTHDIIREATLCAELPSSFSCSATGIEVILAWQPIGHARVGSSPLVSIFVTQIPVMVALGMHDFTTLRETQGMIFDSEIMIQASCTKDFVTQYAMAGKLHARVPDSLRFCYLFRPNAHESIVDALASVPQLSPCTVEDCAMIFPTRHAALRRANHIAMAWPESRLGHVVVRGAPSPWESCRWHFGGQPLQLLYTQPIPRTADETLAD